jgi:hypothetical protein
MENDDENPRNTTDTSLLTSSINSIDLFNTDIHPLTLERAVVKEESAPSNNLQFALVGDNGQYYLRGSEVERIAVFTHAREGTLSSADNDRHFEVLKVDRGTIPVSEINTVLHHTGLDLHGTENVPLVVKEVVKTLHTWEAGGTLNAHDMTVLGINHEGIHVANINEALTRTDFYDDGTIESFYPTTQSIIGTLQTLQKGDTVSNAQLQNLGVLSSTQTLSEGELSHLSTLMGDLKPNSETYLTELSTQSNSLYTTAIAPVSLELVDSSDSGVSEDNRTNKTEPTLTIGLPADVTAGDTLIIRDGSQVLETHLITPEEEMAHTLSITLTTLAEGEHTLTATLTDAHGNVSEATALKAPSILTIDTTASISIDNNLAGDDDVINKDEHDKPLVITGTSEGVEAGREVTVTLNGKTYTTTIENVDADGNGTWTYTVPVADVQALADGSSHIIKANVSDVSANVAETAKSTIMVNTSASIDIVKVTGNDNTINANESHNDVILQGTSTGIAENQIVRIEIVSKDDSNNVIFADTTTVTNVNDETDKGSWSYTLVPSNITTLLDGDYIVNVIVDDDGAGNSTEVATPLNIDTSADVDNNFTVNAVEAYQITNNTEKTDVAVGFTGVDADTVSIAVTFTDSTGKSVEAEAKKADNGTWSVADVNLSTLKDGNISISALTTDDAGNTDTTPLSSLDLDTSADVDNNFTVNAVEAYQITNKTEKTDVAVGFTGVDADTVSITVTFTDTTGKSVEAQATQANGTWSVTDVDLSTLKDGNISISALTTDDAGNIDTTPLSSLDLDTSADVDNNFTVSAVEAYQITNNAEKTDVAVGFTGVDADTVSITVTFTDTTGKSVEAQATQTNGTWSVTGVDLSTLKDGTVKLSTLITDDAGNTDTTPPSSLVLDTQLTAVSAQRTANNHYVFNLDSVDADTSGLKDVKVYKDGTEELLFTITYNGGKVSTVTLEDGYSIIGDITSLIGITIDTYEGHLTIVTTDMAGNTPVSSSTNISLPDVTFVEDTGRSQTDHNSQNGEIGVKVTGTGADRGETLQYRENGGDWKDIKKGSFELDEGIHENVEVRQITHGGTPSSPVSLGTITIDQSSPDKPTAPTVLNDQDTSNGVLVASTTPTLTGTVEANALVTLTYNGHTQTVIADASTGAYSVLLDETLPQGNNAISITATDVAGNISSSFTQNIHVDTQAPTATVKIDDTSLIAGETTTVTVTFDEVPKNFTEADDLTVQGGTLSNGSFDATGLVYTATFTPTAGTDDATNSISLGQAWTDAAGNAPTATATTENFTIDTIRPTATVKIDDTSLIAGEKTSVTVTFTEVPKDFNTTDDLTVEGGTLSNGSFDASGLVYTATFTPTAGTDDATNSISLGQAWTDAAGNAPTADVSTGNFTVHTKVPELEISSSKDGGNIKYIFDFGETVTGFDIGDIDISEATASVADGATLEDKGNGVYTLLVTPKQNTEGDITVKVKAGAAQDVDGNDNTESTLTQSIDTKAGTINIDATLEGDNIVNIAESEDVVISGTTTDIEDGQIVTVNLHDTVNPQNTLEVTATVNNGTWSLTGDQIADISSWENGDITITADVNDANGNPAEQAAHTLTLDKTPPTVEITSDIATTDTGKITYTFTFSEQVTGFAEEDVVIKQGNTIITHTFIDNKDGTYSTSVTPIYNNNGTYDGDLTVTVAKSAVTDTGGNDNIKTVLPYKIFIDDNNNSENSNPSDTSLYDYILLNNGEDILTIKKYDDASIDFGNGEDTLIINTTDAIDLSNIHNVENIDVKEAGTVTGTDEADTITLLAGNSDDNNRVGPIEHINLLGGGSDTIAVDISSDILNHGSERDDNIDLNRFTLDADDRVELQSVDDVYGTSNADTIVLTGKVDDIFLYGGNDTVTLETNKFGEIDLGEGIDSIFISDNKTIDLSNIHNIESVTIGKDSILGGSGTGGGLTLGDLGLVGNSTTADMITINDDAINKDNDEDTDITLDKDTFNQTVTVNGIYNEYTSTDGVNTIQIENTLDVSWQ